ncbi:methyltransferase, partial [Microbacterium sp. 3H14]
TLAFLEKVAPPPQKILDLGVKNPFTEIMKDAGYQVNNTKGEDLDVDFTSVQHATAEVVTAFEIFEHLLAPFNILKEIKATKLIASVPLKLWFSSAYRSKT